MHKILGFYTRRVIQKPKKKMYVYNNDAQISKYFIEMKYTWKWFGSMTTTHNLQFLAGSHKPEVILLTFKIKNRHVLGNTLSLCKILNIYYNK